MVKDNIDVGLLEKHIESVKDKNSNYNKWLRNVIFLSATVLSIIVSLRSGESKNIYEYYSFISTISLIALGILLGAIVLYDEVIVSENRVKNYAEYIEKAGEGKEVYVGTAKHGVLFVFLKKICHISLALSLVSLIVYVIISDYPV